MVKVLVVVSNRGSRPSHYFSDTELHFRERNILRHGGFGEVGSLDSFLIVCHALRLL